MVIFGNEMPKKVVKKANRSKQKFAKKFGDDKGVNYPLSLEENSTIGPAFGVKNITISDKEGEGFDTEKGVIVGNIRMGFGHYRIAMAMASAANALGYTPYWMDLNSYKETTGGKTIREQNKLYSMGSRLSSRFKVFNKFVWEPLNYEGFRKISYNANDLKNAELMTSVFGNIPKDMPYIGTHVWPAQAAVGAGMTKVVNAIPDNWPMALHLAEGSLHTVQTRSSYLGYRALNGMNGKKVLNPMEADDIAYTGHYIDHELVSNIPKDCDLRVARAKEEKPMRFLLTIGGAGAQREIFEAIIKHLLPMIKEKKAALFINVGDYLNVWKELEQSIPELKEAKTFFDAWEDTKKFAEEAIEGNVEGIFGFYHENIFEAVYATNLLMRATDILVTKPSELAFYPIPKLFIKRVGGHEMWGAIHSAEIGDGTIEQEDVPHVLQMIDLLIEDKELIINMCECIKKNNEMEVYSGAYKVVEYAVNGGKS